MTRGAARKSGHASRYAVAYKARRPRARTRSDVGHRLAPIGPVDYRGGPGERSRGGAAPAHGSPGMA